MHRVLSAAAVTLLLGACAGHQQTAEDRPLIPALAAYRMDIRQGNVVDAAMLARLQLGMDRERVRTLIGTPQLVDPFRPDRWDYTFTERKGYQERTQRNVTLVFEGDALARVEGDVLPVAGSREKNLLTASTRTTVDVPAEIENQGRLARLLGGSDETKKKAGRRDLTRFVKTEEARQYETVEGPDANVPKSDGGNAKAPPAQDDENQGIFDGLLGRGDS
jgi:outer membrane protein assembly factor BamE